jgi:thiamine biosynthesis lipoprotein
MGSAFSFTAVHPDSAVARAACDSAVAEVQRIEDLISEWREDSETSRINRAAGLGPMVVNRELFALVQRSVIVSEITRGAFDITFLSAYKLWTFDKMEHPLPDSGTVSGSIGAVGYDRITLDTVRHAIQLAPGARIGFGANGKGYAADCAKHVMRGFGIENGLVNAGGDLLAWGTQANGSAWQVGIADPEDHNRIIAWLDVRDMAVVTSGNYEKFFTHNGRRYAHIINPLTGWPVTGIKSVTVFCDDAELADALATGVFVLGVKEGVALINGLPGIECFIVDEQNTFHTSEGLSLNLK